MIDVIFVLLNHIVFWALIIYIAYTKLIPYLYLLRKHDEQLESKNIETKKEMELRIVFQKEQIDFSQKKITNYIHSLDEWRNGLMQEENQKLKNKKISNDVKSEKELLQKKHAKHLKNLQEIAFLVRNKIIARSALSQKSEIEKAMKHELS